MSPDIIYIRRDKIGKYIFNERFWMISNFSFMWDILHKKSYEASESKKSFVAWWSI